MAGRAAAWARRARWAAPLLAGAARPGSPQPSAALPTPPDDLTPQARQLWDELGARLASLGVLTEMDAEAFEVLIRTWDRWEQAQAQAASGGAVVLNARGRPMLNPAFQAQMKLQAELARWLRHFGLTPTPRLHITAVEPEPDEDDPAVRWLRGLSAESS